MKILIYGINYSPELTGIGKYTGEMAEWLAGKGYQVEVITAMPYYPEWKVAKEYRGNIWFTESIKGVKVKRCPFYVPEEVTGKSRILHELSFLLSSLVWWFGAFFKKYDVVFSVYPPLGIKFWPRIYKLLHRKTIQVVHVQDLQVDAARDLKLIQNEQLLRILESQERQMFRQADKVSTISPGMAEKIINKGISEDKLLQLPNWVDTEFIRPVEREESMRQELGFSPNDKILLYSGNMGEKQGLDILIPVFERLHKEEENIHLVLAGEGASKKRLKAKAEEMNLTNVQFLPLQPYKKLPYFLGIADLHLVIQKKVASDLVLPSKLMSIWSAGGVPVVTAPEGSTLYSVIKEHNNGLLAVPEDEEALYNTLKNALNSDNTAISANARKYAEENLNIDSVLGRGVEEFRR